MGLLDIEIESDISDLIDAINQLKFSIDDVLRFAGGQIVEHIRGEIFGTLVRSLANEAENFPIVYREHLVAFLKLLPIIPEYGNDYFSIHIDLATLGDKEELTLGYHDHAILGEAYPPWESIHLPQVALPWLEGEDDGELMSDQSRRQEFWETVIINRDIEGFLSTLTNEGIRSAIRNKIGDPPTYAQVAARRVGAWIDLGVAPEWLLLEYGTPEGTLPVINPVNFLEVIEQGCRCVADQVIENALSTIMRVFDREAESGNAIKIGALGRPYLASTGQFVKYADIRDETPVDISECLSY